MSKVNIKNLGIIFDCSDSSTLAKACEKNHAPIVFSCHEGICGNCLIKVIENPQNISAKTEKEIKFLETINADPSERLACQCKLNGDITIEITE